MLNIVKAKLATLIQAKVAVAVVGAAVVAGGGAAVATTVTHTNLATVGAALTHTDHTAGDSSAQATQHLSMEGVLQSYIPASGSTSGSISVRPQSGAAVTIRVDANTKINGDTGKLSDSQAKGAQSATLNDLTAAVNHRVQVQADKTSAGWLARKVTIQGAEACAGSEDANGANGSKDAKGTENSHSDAAGNEPKSNATPCAQQTQQQQEQTDQVVHGVVKSVDAANSSFVVATAKGDVTVTVSGSTHFEPGVLKLATLKVGAGVLVLGTAQSQSVVAASLITQITGAGDFPHDPATTPTTGGHTAPEPFVPMTPGTSHN